MRPWREQVFGLWREWLDNSDLREEDELRAFEADSDGIELLSSGDPVIPPNLMALLGLGLVKNHISGTMPAGVDAERDAHAEHGWHRLVYSAYLMGRGDEAEARQVDQEWSE